MSNLLDPFLERFRHPIFSSVVISFSVRNWDHLLPLSASIIHPKELEFFSRYDYFLFALYSEQFCRIVLPTMTGLFIAFFGLPLADWAYASVLANISRRKANTVNSEENKVIIIKAKKREIVLQSIIASIQDRSIVQCIENLSIGAAFGFYRPASDVSEGSFVNYHSQNGTIIMAKHSRGPILGIVYKIISLEVALVVSNGIISDSEFLGKHFSGNPGAITVDRNGKGMSTTYDSHLVANVIEKPGKPGKLQMTLAISESEFPGVSANFIDRLFLN